LANIFKKNCFLFEPNPALRCKSAILQEHYAGKGASFGRSLPARVPKLSEPPVFRCNRGHEFDD